MPSGQALPFLQDNLFNHFFEAFPNGASYHHYLNLLISNTNIPFITHKHFVHSSEIIKRKKQRNGGSRNYRVGMQPKTYSYDMACVKILILMDDPIL